MKVKSESEVAQSCLTLSNLMDCSLPGSSVHGIFQVRVLEWGASKFGKLSIDHRTQKGQFSFLSQRRAMPKNAKVKSEVAQSCLTLSDPMDCSLPGSSVHGIFQARVLEWGAIAFSD